MRSFFFLLLCISPAGFLLAQAPPATTACTFQGGSQISVRYQQAKIDAKKSLPLGEIWPPDQSPIFLFTQSAVSIGNTNLPIGAYRIYVMPEKKSWTLIINKAVAADAHYDQQQDVVRVQMEIGNVGSPATHVDIAFGHIAPKQCNMRIYYGKVGAFTEFKEQ